MKLPVRLLLSAVVISTLISEGSVAAQTTTVYVDGTIGPASCVNYSVATRACGSGTATAYKTIASAGAASTAGMAILIRGGAYRESLVPPSSGTQAQPIVFRRFGTEAPSITGVEIGITLTGRAFVEIDGLTVTDVAGWVRLQDSANITIRNSTFQRATATGTTGGVKLVRSTFNRILDNVIQDGNDNVELVDASDHNLVQGNTLSTGRHSLMTVRCSNQNIFRGNTFDNPSQKALEIYDCEGVGSDSPIRYDATKHNVFEDNAVTKTRSSVKNNDYNAIQHGAQYTIVRRNVFRNNDGGGVNYQEYANESRYVSRNRMYNNTFYANRCNAIIGDNGTANYFDNRVTNNLLYKNVDCSGAAVQTSIPDTSAVILTHNAVETADPGFVNEAANDFHLAPASREIDAGAALTATTGAGSGTRLPVQDAAYFTNGNGIAGELGDTIQFLGRSTVARIVDVDYAGNVLVLDRSLTWSAGEGVALQYSGNAPDMGAFESGGAGASRPSAPTNLRIVSP
jgi:hypothetical protein